MWRAEPKRLNPEGTLELRFLSGDACLSYAGVLDALQSDGEFRELLIDALRDAPFTAFRWETPPVTTATASAPFCCLLHDSPDLDVPADPTDFEAYFEADQDVVCFDNLGGDAHLVVPCPVSAQVDYSHIASFHRTAPTSQQHALWQAVARAMGERIGSRPVWLSTAGGGVDWLHVRLDDRPKYYRHREWRNPPRARPNSE